MLGLSLSLLLNLNLPQTKALGLHAPTVYIIEGEDPLAEDDAPKPKPKIKRKPRPKKPKPAPNSDTLPSEALPSGPQPYLAASAHPAPIAPPLQALPTKAEPLLPKHEAIAPQTEPVPLVSVPYSPPPPEPMAKEINLRCETLTTVQKRSYSRGLFHLSLIPSEVHPDEFADLRVMSIDQKHQSIIRDIPDRKSVV